MTRDRSTLSEKSIAIANRILAAEGPVTALELVREFGPCSTYIDTLLRRGEISRLSRGCYVAVEN